MDLHSLGLRPTSPTRPPSSDQMPVQSPSQLGMWQKLHNFFGGDETSYCLDPIQDLEPLQSTEKKPPKMREGSRRPIGVGLPRQTTFKRQNSEKRDRLCPVETQPDERRALSMARGFEDSMPKTRSLSSPAPFQNPRSSAPAVGNTAAAQTSATSTNDMTHTNGDAIKAPSENDDDPEQPRPLRPASVTSSNDSYERERDFLDERAQLNAELDNRWILNLSMHFRDKSDREKFFITYAEKPNKWRRVTVSVDYRNAEAGSLEMDLKELALQRDKSLQIYEAIRESLLEIQFYNTVTNLKLETNEGRLHVHVTEDVNEIIPYPSRNSLTHVLEYGPHIPMECRESDLIFEAHLSGFVYKVNYKGRTLIKKEIPGPDTVDEFLYEVNALHALSDSNFVIRLEGIVLDDTYSIVKGLLISYAEKGAVVDLLYDLKGEIPWERRQRWARHAVAGLRDVHEEGYVQGDFTLSNIVVDDRDNARIIDINRRGCPVGWEPPELAQKIASNQRISMYIGQKSDLYQLGMSLWALAMDDDEPERHDPPLSTQVFPTEIPAWYAEIVRICLSPKPRDRLSAKVLLEMFPNVQSDSSYQTSNGKLIPRLRTPKQYIDPETAVERDDLERFGHERNPPDATMYSPQSSREDYTFTYPRSSNDDRDYYDSISEFERPRGRRRFADYGGEIEVPDGNLNPQNQHDESPPLIERIPTPVGYTARHLTDDHSGYFEPNWRSVDSSPEQGQLHRGRSPGQRAISADLATSRPSMHDSTEPSYPRSQITDPTPKNSALHLASHSDMQNEELQDTLPVDGDLAWLGAHPNIGSEQENTSDVAVSTEQTDSLDFLPPRLRFVDSGFNEPGTFGMAEDDTGETCEGDSDDEVENNLAESRRNRDLAQLAAQSSGRHEKVNSDKRNPSKPDEDEKMQESTDSVLSEPTMLVGQKGQAVQNQPSDSELLAAKANEGEDNTSNANMVKDTPS